MENASFNSQVHFKIDPWSLRQKACFSKQASTHQSEHKVCTPPQSGPSLFLQEGARFWGRRTGQAVPWGRDLLSISILLQRLITLLCTSHTGQCAPSLKWYKIQMVQPVPGGTSGRGGDSPRVGRHRAEGTPSQGCWCPGEGALGRGEAGGCPCVREPGAPIMCIMGSAAHGAGGAPCQPHSHPHSLFPCSPSPWSVLEQGKAPQPPRNSEGWETGETCWNDALKKQRWRQEQQKVPLWLVFLTMIKTSMSAPA